MNAWPTTTSSVNREVRDGELHFVIDHESTLQSEERLELFIRRVLRVIHDEESRIWSLSPETLRTELRELILRQSQCHIEVTPEKKP